MISYLKGAIKLVKPAWIILEVAGVGYKVYISDIGNWKLEIGNSLEAYTYHHIREDRQELYGFKSPEELDFFELLLGVNGVGPKMAISIMSRASIEKIKEAIVKSDTTLLTAVSRVGKKLASKIIIELRSKLGQDSDLNLGEGSQEVVDALESLGYRKGEIVGVLSKIPSDIKTTEEKVKWVLKNKK